VASADSAARGDEAILATSFLAQLQSLLDAARR